MTKPNLRGWAGILAAIAVTLTASAQRRGMPQVRHDVPRDSIQLSDPAILADSASQTYYMTGTGGMLWKSRDLERWSGPYIVAQPDTASWMGRRPMIWAAELHKYEGRYYYFATFTNNATTIMRNSEGTDVPRRASHILVADTPDGPYRPLGPDDYLPAGRPTLDGTFWVDTDGKPYMVFCGEWLYDMDGTMEAVELTADLSRPAGEPCLLFKASDSPWSRENGTDGAVKPNRVTDGPWLFRTATRRLGMIWTSWVFDKYTMGVAYSDSGTLRGPWIQDPEPLTPPDFGHGMIFTDLRGRTLLSLHSHSNRSGHYERHPVLWEVDLSGDRLRLGKRL